MLSNIKLKKDMTNEEVNKLIKVLTDSKLSLELLDSKYKGYRIYHKWNYDGEIIELSFEKLKCIVKYKNMLEKIDKFNYKSIEFGKKRHKVICECKNCGAEKVFLSDRNFEIRCTECCQDFENSFKFFIENEVGLKIEDIWADTNRYNPEFLYKSSSKKVILKDPNGKVLPPLKCNSIVEKYKRNGTIYSISNTSRVNEADSLGEKYKEIANMIDRDEDGNKVNTKNIAPNSHKKVYIKCPYCNHIGSAPLIVKNILRHGYSCEFCSTGIPMTERFISALLYVNNIKYKRQKVFDWSRKIEQYEEYKDTDDILKGDKRYDFYLIEYDEIAECQGRGHYVEIKRGDKARNLEQEEENDKIKKELALKKGYSDKYHIIEFNYKQTPTLEYMKNAVKSSIKGGKLKEIIDNMDEDKWNEVWKICKENLIAKVAKLFNEGKNAKEIAKDLSLSHAVICKYLNKAREFGYCDYDARKEQIKGMKNRRPKLRLILSNGEEKKFKSKKELSKYLGISYGSFITYINPYINVKSINIEEISDKNYWTKEYVINPLKTFNGVKIIEIKG